MTERERERESIRLHLGCGNKRLEGWLNVDIEPHCHPDMVVDLEQLPWPWEDDSVEEVMLNHVLEHIGETRNLYLGIIRELYRVCRNGALIHIRVPHPRHDHFLTDPTHVRPILVEGLQMFDKEFNQQCIDRGWANTPLGIYLDVNLKILSHQYVLEERYLSMLREKRATAEQIMDMVRTQNNVCSQINIEMQCIK